MNLNKTFELMSKAADQGFANLRKAADINLSTWDQLVATQMAVMNQCLETTNKQMELMKTAKRVDDMVGRQTELARELGEKLVESNKEIVEIINKSSEDYQALVEASVEQAKSQMDEAAEAVTKAAA
jgi:phasin family protein